jgi:hypothetical protein
MAATVHVSRLGDLLRQRRLSVPKLQGRLAARGYPTSRGALDRLASDEPIEEIRLSVVRPILRELGVPFEAVFEEIDADELAARRQRHAQARALARAVGRPGAADGAGPAGEVPTEELRSVIARAAAELARSHPGLVDARGRVRRRALEAALRERLGDGGALTGEAYDRLIAPGLSAPGGAALATDLAVLC